MNGLLSQFCCKKKDKVKDEDLQLLKAPLKVRHKEDIKAQSTVDTHKETGTRHRHDVHHYSQVELTETTPNDNQSHTEKHTLADLQETHEDDKILKQIIKETHVDRLLDDICKTIEEQNPDDGYTKISNDNDLLRLYLKV